MSVSNKAAGGKAAAAKRTTDERKQIANMGVKAKKDKALLPTIVNEGILQLGNLKLEVAVLSTGDRVVTETSVFTALGRSQRGRKTVTTPVMLDDILVPAFMDAKNLIPFVSDDLKKCLTKIKCKTKSGTVRESYNALILPLVGDLYLSARENDAITSDAQLEAAQKAEILVRSLAKVGIIALVDEATGYQKDRERDALAKILEQFITTDMRPWVKTFPAEFFEQLCRIRGIPFKANKTPSYFGHLINDLVYGRMAPGLRLALKEEKKKADKPNVNLHQFLTDNTGVGVLFQRLASMTDIMRLVEDGDYDGFYTMWNKIYPTCPDVTEIIID